jgi:5-methylcytosine-specific restriction enzyme subunit McrC
MQDDLRVLRGKLDVGRQITRGATRADRLACSFDELSADTPLNRVLKATVKRLASTTRSSDNRRRLAELGARLEFVGDSADPSREAVMLDRTNTAFHQLYALARLLLRGDWQDTTSGKQEGFALLFPMNELFEDFVGRTMRSALAPTSVRLQDSGRHALDSEGERLFALRPDIVVDGGIVVDTKWKKLKPQERMLGVEQADVYQMLAYARAYGARRLILLYPWHTAMPPPGIIDRGWRIAGTSTPFDIATVDVGKPEEVAGVIREIVGEPRLETMAAARGR